MICLRIHKFQVILNWRQLVQQVHQELPYLGEIMVMGRLQAMGYQVTRWCLRQTLHEVDPINTILRWGASLQTRQPYSVPGPNSLWHMVRLEGE